MDKITELSKKIKLKIKLWKALKFERDYNKGYKDGVINVHKCVLNDLKRVRK